MLVFQKVPSSDWLREFCDLAGLMQLIDLELAGPGASRILWLVSKNSFSRLLFFFLSLFFSIGKPVFTLILRITERRHQCSHLPSCRVFPKYSSSSCLINQQHSWPSANVLRSRQVALKLWCLTHQSPDAQISRIVSVGVLFLQDCSGRTCGMQKIHRTPLVRLLEVCCVVMLSNALSVIHNGLCHV